LDAVENSLRKMSERAEPLTVFLGRQPGQREPRWMHLMGGPVSAETLAELTAPAPHRAARTGHQIRPFPRPWGCRVRYHRGKSSLRGRT